MAKQYKNHYDNTRLINSLDADGNRPAFYIVCSRERGPGKTFSFAKLLYNNFVSDGSKFILLTRNQGNLGDIAPGVFDGFLQVEHPDVTIEEKIQMKGVFSRIYMVKGTGDKITKDECGYVIPLRAADAIKKISSLFYDATAFYFDEFQPTSKSSYLKDELDLLYSIYKSVARGNGSAIRYMPVYMASNTISLGNPYFSGFNLNGAIQSNTKFYKGHGVVFENCEVTGLAEAHKSSAIDIAMARHLSLRGDNTWLNDDGTLVEKPMNWGRGIYICTLLYNSQSLGVYEYIDVDRIYISRTYDKNSKYVYALTLENGALNYPVLRVTPYLDTLKQNFFKGKVRVQDSGLQSMLMDVFG